MSEKTKHFERVLRESTESQIRTIQGQSERISRFYKTTLKDLMVRGYDSEEALKTARGFWRMDRIGFVAIDGSMYQDNFFDLAVFYGGAYASLGQIDFAGGLRIDYAENHLRGGQGVSTCIPLYIAQIPEVDQVFLSDTGEKEQKPILGD